MKSELYGPIARMILNTLGTALVTAGVLAPDVAAQVTGSPEALTIATGAVAIAAQYVGWGFAKLKGWAT